MAFKPIGALQAQQQQSWHAVSIHVLVIKIHDCRDTWVASIDDTPGGRQAVRMAAESVGDGSLQETMSTLVLQEAAGSSYVQSSDSKFGEAWER